MTAATPRSSSIHRVTKETDITLNLGLDGRGNAAIDTGVPFLDHMLTLTCVHGFFDLTIQCQGDTEVDDHHTVEDVGICLGRAFKESLGDFTSITRYGHAMVPMDEALVRAAVDLSNRAFLHYDLPVREEKIGLFDSALAKEFFRAVVLNGGLTLHLDLLHGENGHHILEAAFKAWGRAMAQATSPLDISGALSSKGSL